MCCVVEGRGLLLLLLVYEGRYRVFGFIAAFMLLLYIPIRF